MRQEDKMAKKKEDFEDKTYIEDDNNEIPPSDIVAYNESRSCADLFRMFNQGILQIQPEFQREIVWQSPAQTRFIDSLTKQLPIPSLCFSMDYKTMKWQVIDGLQRMASIIRFLSGDPNWILSKLDDIDPNLSGKPAKDFLNKKSELHDFYIRVENLTLPITVLRCDYSKKTHTNYLFTIFHRLNTGAMKLNNQEIRNCIYSGSFNDLIKNLNEFSDWRILNKIKKDVGYRFTKQEQILRFFALFDKHLSYNGRLAKFLNEYMNDNKEITDEEKNIKTELFKRTVTVALKNIFAGEAPSKLPLSVLEATLVGIAKNINKVETYSSQKLDTLYQKLLKHEEFSETKLSEGLSGKTRVINRIDAAISIFKS
jgi:hypothetical protein